ncbi:uncharacterized protein LOC117245213 isoform X2 [Parus major]|uniref:uncharacterized protein LOC117245213 isoform X2 n=1 Tax=Parus major TaxID=9157 RepID=UPI001443A141|nr:uncharacterized protein LOC117245213 isoform X2 [Parus major]
MLSVPRQPRRARLLRRAAQSSGPSGVPAERGMRPQQPGRIPEQGPSISTASLPVTQHPPPRSRFLPAPGNRRRHAQRMLPQNAEGREALMRTAPQAARGAGSTKQCQGSAGSQRLNPATRSRRMSVQSQLALPRRSCRIQLATFPPRNSYPGAVATREGHPAPQMQPRGEV